MWAGALEEGPPSRGYRQRDAAIAKKGAQSTEQAGKTFADFSIFILFILL